MIKEFIKQLMNKLNEYYTVFYEEADKNTSFPYLVVPTLNITPLNAGYRCLVDIEIYTNELSETTIETIVETLKNGLDEFSFNNEKIAFHLGLDNIYLSGSNEQDLKFKRITFEARIFEKGGIENAS